MREALIAQKYGSTGDSMGNCVETANQSKIKVQFHMNQIDRTLNILPILGVIFGCGTLRTITQSWQECKLGNYITDKPKFNQLMM